MMTTDEKIADGSFHIPEEMLQFSENEREKTLEAVIPLSGKQGQEREGVLTMVFTFRDINIADTIQNRRAPMFIPSSHRANYAGRFLPYTSVQPIVPPYPTQTYITSQNEIPTFRQEDFNLLQEMFPKIQGDIIRTTLLSNHGNVDATTTALLELNSTTQ